MQAFTSHRGKIALLDRGNIDTDQIIAKQYLKSIKRTGYGEFLFDDWRYDANRRPNSDFPLNQARYQGASLLVAGNNFGCGSSREHAVWAVVQYGFRVVIAPRWETDNGIIPAFADIFRNNSVKNGLLTIELDPHAWQQVRDLVQQHAGLEATVDLPQQQLILHAPQELRLHFEMDAEAKRLLVNGLDDIGQTLQHEAAMQQFEAKHNAQLYT